VERRTLLIVAGAGLVLVGGLVLTVSLTRSRPEPAPAPAVTEAPKPVAPPPARKPAPAPPAPSPSPRVARATPEPKAAPEPPPEPAAPVVETATLRIDTDVPGAQVFMDREFLGATPVTAQGVKPGPHRLNLSVQGFEGIAREIEVAPGPHDILIRFKEVTLKARIEVIHKHRMGSCKGQLVATPKGLRYETTNKEDAFATPLLDLEVFQIDYLEKRLRVKLPKGRQFDFTDPENNADRLFVFHRDVEKARVRLQKGDPPAQE
jgi:hypothetical protein